MGILYCGLGGQSFCGDQSKSFWLSPGSTYWHIQMPSVYCENRSIGWNNTVTGDNVPVRDDLWSSFGFTDSGAFMCFPPATVLRCRSSSRLQYGACLLFFFWFSNSCLCSSTPLAAFPLFSHCFPHPAPFQTPTSYTPRLPCFPYERPPFYPQPPRRLPRLIVTVFRSVVDISHLLS